MITYRMVTTQHNLLLLKAYDLNGHGWLLAKRRYHGMSLFISWKCLEYADMAMTDNNFVIFQKIWDKSVATM